MRDFWTFIGGIAVGILAVTGVYAMDKEEPSSLGHDEDVPEELDEDIEEETDDDGKLTVRSS